VRSQEKMSDKERTDNTGLIYKQRKISNDWRLIPDGKQQRTSVWETLGKHRLAYAFILPALIVVGAVILYPLIEVFKISFERYYLVEILTKGASYVGLANYLEILRDPEFWHSLGITVIFTAACVILTMLVGLAVALLLNLEFPGQKLVAVAILIPWVMPRVASSILWKWIYDDQFGILNYLLSLIGFKEMASFPWLANPSSALWAVIIVIVWQSFPFIAVCLLAALQSISVEIFEAARIDGAGPWQRLRFITMPLLRNILGILTVISTIWDFKAFDQMWVLTEGGPAGSTMILGIHTWMSAFAYLRMGRASALAIIMLLLVTVVTLLYLKLFIREEDDNG